MSSVYSEFQYQPAMCIDGLTSNQGHGDEKDVNICLSAVGTPDPWLAISLAARSVVEEVVVFGRSDCCNGMLRDFEVWVGDEVATPSSAGRWHLCGRIAASLPNSGSVTAVPCGGVEGVVVVLRLPGKSRTISASAASQT